jgi:hypothetical protein
MKCPATWNPSNLISLEWQSLRRMVAVGSCGDSRVYSEHAREFDHWHFRNSCYKLSNPFSFSGGDGRNTLKSRRSTSQNMDFDP